MWQLLAALGKGLATAGSKALAFGSKAGSALWQGAQGVGKGLAGASSKTTPLSIGKTAAPALNASARAIGQNIGSAMRSGGADLLMSKLIGGSQTPNVESDFQGIQQQPTITSGENAPLLMPQGQSAPIGLMTPADIEYIRRMRQQQMGGGYGY
jgi:hypothetical protein